MRNKILILLAISLYTQLALAAEIKVTGADYIWNMTFDNATDIHRLVGEPGVMVVKYADNISYQPLENASHIGRLVGGPGVMVVKYADIISYQSLDNPINLGRGFDIKINNTIFNKSVITIPVNSMVTWINLDNITHTVTADDGSFDSGNIKENQTYNRLFNVSGSYKYHCKIHSSMTGTVIVTSEKGDNQADAGDLVSMKRYDLNNNGISADVGDLVLMKRASIGEIVNS